MYKQTRSLFLSSLLVSAAFFPQLAVADDQGVITIVGQGHASSVPEFTRLRVDVTSICYDSSRAAKDANAALANQILAILQRYQLNVDDKVTASGGINELRTEVTYYGTESRVLCEMKWRATNSLVLEMSSFGVIPDIQDEVLGVVDAMAVNPNLVSQTYAELGQPSFLLRDTTLQALKRTAQAAAYDDARLQFAVFQNLCQFGSPRLTRIEPPQYAVYARKDGVALSAEGSGSTPIIPDDLAVDATWKFTWNFVPVEGCSR